MFVSLRSSRKLHRELIAIIVCIKICNPTGSNNPGYCQHTLDRIGLLYNCPSKYTAGGGFQAGEFEICDSDLMTVPGIYVDASGATQSYAQPPESLGEITSIPYTPTVVASSNCQTFASSALFTELAAATGATSSASASVSTTTYSICSTNSFSGPRAEKCEATRLRIDLALPT